MIEKMKVKPGMVLVSKPLLEYTQNEGTYSSWNSPIKQLDKVLWTVEQIAKNVNNFIKDDFNVKVGSKVLITSTPEKTILTAEKAYFIIHPQNILAVFEDDEL
jgi:co-chaperonin GroES (HSP10)